MAETTAALPVGAEKKISSTADIGALYQQYQPWLVSWLRGKLGCPHDAADISHDTFLKLMAGNSVSLREPRAYLLVIANRLLINRYRRSKVEADVLRHVANLIDIHNSGVNNKDPADIVVTQDLLSRVLLMLTEELPEKPRKAYLMARIDGLNYREIATRLQVSESSVKQYMTRVMVHCHKRFYDECV